MIKLYTAEFRPREVEALAVRFTFYSVHNGPGLNDLTEAQLADGSWVPFKRGDLATTQKEAMPSASDALVVSVMVYTDRRITIRRSPEYPV